MQENQEIPSPVFCVDFKETESEEEKSKPSQ